METPGAAKAVIDIDDIDETTGPAGSVEKARSSANREPPAHDDPYIFYLGMNGGTLEMDTRDGQFYTSSLRSGSTLRRLSCAVHQMVCNKLANLHNENCPNNKELSLGGTRDKGYDCKGTRNQSHTSHPVPSRATAEMFAFRWGCREAAFDEFVSQKGLSAEGIIRETARWWPLALPVEEERLFKLLLATVKTDLKVGRLPIIELRRRELMIDVAQLQRDTTYWGPAFKSKCL